MNKAISVLVVEDDYLVSEEIVRGLRGLGYETIFTASDGTEAVSVTCASRPGVVLMDIQLPELDGIAAADRIQELCPTPIVVLTAYESPDLLQQASAAGVSAYLTKPPRPEDIERAITLAVARHADLMELKRLNKELEKALAEIQQLRGIIPICAYCKKIRDDQGYWEQVEQYISRRSTAVFSHGICPQCLKTVRTEIQETIKGTPGGEGSKSG